MGMVESRWPMGSLFKHWDLVWQLTRREIMGRYRGAGFGLAWSIITPFMMLVIYTFAFGTVMQGKWPDATRPASFSLVLFAGLIVHGFFAECITRAPMLVVSNPNFVKRVVFPLDVLPWPMLFSATFHLMMNLLVFCVLRMLMDRAFSPGIVLFPVVMLPLAVLCVGIAWWLSALGVYLRDLNQVMGLIATATLFLSSAIMPRGAVPERFRWVIDLNPISFIVDQARAILLWQQAPNWLGLLAYLLLACIVLVTGWWWFKFTRRAFADVI